MRISTITISTLLLTLPVWGQRNFDEVSIEAQRVAGSVYMMTGAGGNIGVAIGDDGVLLIDDQFAPLVPKIEAALAELTDKQLKWILNTHWHGDHTGGNELLGKTAPVVAHHNVRKRMLEGSVVHQAPPADPEALPVLTFGKDLQIWLSENEAIHAIHIPHAHTDGDAVIWFPESNVIHMGDLFFSGLFPFIDLDSGGSVQGLIDGIHHLLGRIPPDTTIIPGHGPLSTVEDLQTYATMLRETSTIVRRAIEDGKTLEEVKEENLLGEYHDDWNWGFISTERYLETLYRDLQ